MEKIVSELAGSTTMVVGASNPEVVVLVASERR
jgi:hypothetical protein